ncbi:ABC transporter substrate-binding protein [Natrononativus amylolyticus]|uniref:ABC transporter substrate-binding protein n=1 Tax=Natrononativus amylolyticus TaxID=2963434 RepID=UPI0020CBC0E9|nr:ABC transporter substrate-binding protein [Natrononativus amylolyticus]
MDDVAPSPTRRRLLGGLGVATASALAGCSERFWSRAEDTSPEQVSLTIKTLPSDDDPVATKISSKFADNLADAGIDVVREPVGEAELYREVLIDRDYDLFIARHPGFDELDALRSLLHSRFVSEQGWQNPFSFSDVTADEYLERQRSEEGGTRETTFEELFEHLLETAPYTTVAFPDHVGATNQAVAVDRPPRTLLDYVELLGREPEDGPRDGALRVGLFGQQVASRLNPIVVDLRDVSTQLGLLYDPLVRRVDGDELLWLAEEIEWEDDNGRVYATVTLRDGLTWHDDEPLDADDVAFTYRFLADTSLGEVEGGVPAPRYRGRQTLVDDVAALDSERVRFWFEDVSREVARRVFSIPLLPEHVWEATAEVIGDHRTEALAWDNEEPVGSGLFAFADSSDEHLRLEPFEEHVFRTLDDDELPSVFEGFSQYDGIEFRISPNAGAAVEALADGDIDLIASELRSENRAEVDERDELSLVRGTSRSFYVIGYNLRHPELTNLRFRQVLSQLIDRDHVVSEFFDGHAEPAASHSSLVGIHPDDWDRQTSRGVPTFPGTDGELDRDEARELFEEVGYRYDDGELIA